MNDRKVIEGSVNAEAESSAAGNKRPGPLVEDSSVAGGLDAQGRPVIKPKNIDGKIAEDATDPRESR